MRPAPARKSPPPKVPTWRYRHGDGRPELFSRAGSRRYRCGGASGKAGDQPCRLIENPPSCGRSAAAGLLGAPSCHDGGEDMVRSLASLAVAATILAGASSEASAWV